MGTDRVVEALRRRAVAVFQAADSGHGPDPLDVGGLAEIKWVAEYADLHGLQIAPHGILDGLIGLAALVHVSVAMP